MLPFGAGGHSALYGRTDQVAPLRPGAVIIRDFIETQQVFEGEPGVAGPLADAAVGDDGPGTIDALRGIERPQLIGRFERAILIGRLAPRNVARARDMTAALTGFGQSGRGQD